MFTNTSFSSAIVLKYILLLAFLTSFQPIFCQNNYRVSGEASREQSTLPHRTITDNNTDNVEVDYSFQGANVTSTTVKKTVYNYLHIEGFSKMHDVGKPALPVHIDLIALPSNSEAVVSIIESEWQELENYMIHPALKPASDAEGAPEPRFEINRKLYRTDAYFPKNIVDVIEIQKLRGASIANVQIKPVQFNPVTGKIRVYSRIKYRIEFVGSGKSFDYASSKNSRHFTTMLKNYVLNYQSIPNGNLILGSNSSRKDYIIVTQNDYLAVADSLANWKRQLGYSVEIVSKSIWTIAEVNDSIHKRYWTWNPRPDYVVLLGDNEDVPAQLIQKVNPADNYLTDLYFVCMDGSADYYADMARGRISVSSSSEAMTVVQKIINYERNPVNDPAFYSKGVNCAQYQDDNHDSYADRRFTHTCEEVRDYMLGQGYNVNRVYYTDQNVTPFFYNKKHYSNGDTIPIEIMKPGFAWNGGPAKIISLVDSGRFYLLHRDHGYVGGSGWASPYFTKPNIDALNNGNKLPVVFSINCCTGEFLVAECFAEKFLRKPNGGAVGVFAASHVSYSGYNDAITVGLFDAIWSNPGIIPDFGTGGVDNPSVSAHEDIYTMGDVLNHGLIRMTQTWGASRNQNQLFHYFGDPAMKIWTAYPVQITANHADTLSDEATYITISNASCPDALATMLYDGELVGKTQLVNGYGQITFNPLFDTSKVAILTLSKHNFVPYTAHINIVSGSSPLNDEPCNAVELQVGVYCDPFLASNQGATNSFPTPTLPCGNYNGTDIWFFARIPSGGDLTIEGSIAVNGFADGAMAVYSGNCINLVFIECDDNDGVANMPKVELTGKTPGDTIYIRFWDYGGIQSGFFNICAYDPVNFPYASLPYYTGFENGLDQYWDTISSNGNGDIRIDSNYIPVAGNFHLTMDTDTAGFYAQNEAWLHLNLDGETNVQLSFWWKEFNDESNSSDGVFFSDDGGQNFTKIFNLTGDYQKWEQIILDVDQMANIYGLSFTDKFIVKFQQYDNWFIGSDGFAFDEIKIISVDTVSYAPLPYSTGFESGLDQYWTATSLNYNGRIRVSPYNTPHTDSVHLSLDVNLSDLNYNTNEACLHLDLSNQTSVLLKFWFKDIGDESHAEDGIYLSDDNGDNYVKVFDLTGISSGWKKIYLYIDQLAMIHGLNLNNEFIIKFQEYDNYPIGSDGFVFDDILVNNDSLSANMLVQPDSLFFATDTGTQQIESVTVYNTGTDTLFVDLNIIPSNVYSFVPQNFNVLAGDSQLVTVTFSPTEIRNYNGPAVFFANSFPNTETVYLTGTVTYPLSPFFITDKDTIDFDTVGLNSINTRIFKISNTGDTAGSVINITTPTCFHIFGDTSFMIPNGSFKMAFVRFIPTQELSYIGPLVIHSDANQDTIIVKGVGLSLSAIHENDLNSNVFVYPNPTSNIIYIQFNKYCSNVHIRLYNSLGDIVDAIKNDNISNNTLQLDISGIAQGLYFLSIHTREDTIMKKIFITH